MVGYGSAWATLNLEQGQWIQVDLGDITKVTKIGTQGRGDSSQWVTEYKVSYSFDGGYFEFYKQQPYGDERVSLQKRPNLACDNFTIFFRFLRQFGIISKLS